MSQQQAPPADAWPLVPDANAFARKGASDGRLLNASAAHLRGGLDYIRYRAQADLVLSDGSPYIPPDSHEPQEAENNAAWKRPKLHNTASWTKSKSRWIFPLIMLVLGGLLGVGVTQGAFYIFEQSPENTKLMTIAVELLFLYSAYIIGARLRAWHSIGRIDRAMAMVLLAMTAMTALAVGYIRVLALDSGMAPVGTLPRLVMFGSLALLLIAATIDTGLHGLETEPQADPPSLRMRRMKTTTTETNGRSTDLSQIEKQRLHEAARHSQWMACLHTYLQAYRGAAAPELMPEIEAVDPEEIPYPTRRRTQGEPSRDW